MDKLLIESVEEYLTLFSSKNDFTTKDAFKAMLHQYLEVKMVDLYLNVYPNELFILSYDYLGISITTKSLNYLQVEFKRCFRFNNHEDECQIRLELHFKNFTNDSNYDKYFRISTTDGDDFFNDQINCLKKESFYKKVKNTKPNSYYLQYYYDF